MSDSLKKSNDSIDYSIEKLTKVIDNISSNSYAMKHTNFEITKAMRKLKDDMFLFENKNLKEDFTNIVTSDKMFPILIVLVMIILTIYYFMTIKQN